MKRYITMLTPLIVLLLAPIMASAQTNASGVEVPPEPTFNKKDAAAYGLQLATYAEAFDSGWVDSYTQSKMTLFDARGDSVDRMVTQRILEGGDGDKSLVKFMKPAEIRGVAALTHEHPQTTDDSWLYLPASRRVRRVSGANRTASFQGTEFTYEDLSSVTTSRYRWKFIGDVTLDGAAVHKLQAVPTYKDTGYSKLEIYLNAEHWRPEKVVFFDKAGKKLKTLKNSKWAHLHGRYWRARHIEMTNHQTRKRTVIQAKTILVNLSRYKRKDGSARPNLTSQQFTRRALEKG